MNVAFEASFARDLKRLRNKSLLRQVQQLIEQVKSATMLNEIRNLKPGATVDIGLRIENFASSGSDDRLIAVIDPADDVFETNEENNISVSSVIK